MVSNMNSNRLAGIALVYLASALFAGSALAQAPRINLNAEKMELESMGLTPSQSEDAEGNSVLIYDLGSSQPETRVTFQDCNAAGCTTALFRQRYEGVCISQRCRDFREARGMPPSVRLDDADIAGLNRSDSPATIRLQDGEHAQQITIERIWTASAEERFSESILTIDSEMSMMWQSVRELLRPGP